MLMSSMFGSNTTNDIPDVVNQGGQIQCDAMECLPFCTACQLVPSQMPTPAPMPTSHHPTEPPPQNVRARDKATSIPVLLMAAGLGGALAVAIAVGLRRRRLTRCGRRTVIAVNVELRVGEGGETLSGHQPLLHRQNAQRTELVGYSVMASYERSLAPIFVVGRNSMRVVTWSWGMAIAVPTLVDPVGMPIVDLPFVDPRDGQRFDQSLRRIFEAPAEHENTQTFMLHLRTRSGRALIETRADHLITELEPIVVMTGRTVDSDLACIMARESVVAGSESDYDATVDLARLRSVSEVGSIQGDDAYADGGDSILDNAAGCQVPGEDADAEGTINSDDIVASLVSSLTMPTFGAHSNVNGTSVISSMSSLTISDRACARESDSELSSVALPLGRC